MSWGLSNYAAYWVFISCHGQVRAFNVSMKARVMRLRDVVTPRLRLYQGPHRSRYYYTHCCMIQKAKQNLFCLITMFVWLELTLSHVTSPRGERSGADRRGEQIKCIAAHRLKKSPYPTFGDKNYILVWRISIILYFFWCLLLILIWDQVYSKQEVSQQTAGRAVHLYSN